MGSGRKPGGLVLGAHADCTSAWLSGRTSRLHRWWRGVRPTMLRGAACGRCLQRREDGEGSREKARRACADRSGQVREGRQPRGGVGGALGPAEQGGRLGPRRRRLCGFRFLCRVHQQRKQCIDLKTSSSPPNEFFQSASGRVRLVHLARIAAHAVCSRGLTPECRSPRPRAPPAGAAALCRCAARVAAAREQAAVTPQLPVPGLRRTAWPASERRAGRATQ